MKKSQTDPKYLDATVASMFKPSKTSLKIQTDGWRKSLYGTNANGSRRSLGYFPSIRHRKMSGGLRKCSLRETACLGRLYRLSVDRCIGNRGADSSVCSGAGFIIILFSANGTKAFFSHNCRRVSYHAAISTQIKSNIAH